MNTKTPAALFLEAKKALDAFALSIGDLQRATRFHAPTACAWSDLLVQADEAFNAQLDRLTRTREILPGELNTEE